ncbi:MAG: preprotein translocase subunit SecE [Desulfobacula sp.]|nr:preprotein translocase subunit SecE [Desulfobacula sp.]
MSRLQKKKTVSEKKKKNTVLDSQTDLSSGSAMASTSKSAVVAGAVKKKPEKKIVESKTGEPNFFQRAIEFLREVQIELKKVTWPTRKQTTGTTIVVIIFVFIVAAFLGVFDFGLSKIVQIVLT